jgi:hypothetical protein
MEKQQHVYAFKLWYLHCFCAFPAALPIWSTSTYPTVKPENLVDWLKFGGLASTSENNTV